MVRLLAVSVLSYAVVGCGARTLQNGSADRSSQGSGGEGAAPPEPATGCSDPQPLLQAGTTLDSGFVRCADGFVHRAQQVTCAAPAAPGDCGASDYGECASDADCTASPYGACVEAEPWYGCACAYGCATDADCGAGQICACAGVVGGRARCIPAQCSASGECGDGLCGLSTGVGSCGEVWGRLGCHDAAAECRVDADCLSEETIWCQGSYVPPQCKLLDQDWTCTEPWGCGPCG